MGKSYLLILFNIILFWIKGASGYQIQIPGYQPIGNNEAETSDFSQPKVKEIQRVALGPLVIESGQFQFFDRDLSLEIQGTLFKKEIRGSAHVNYSIKDKKRPAVDSLTFSFTFVEPYVIEKIYGIPFIITDGQIVYAASKPPILEARSTIKGIPITVVMQLSPSAFEKTKISVEKIPFGVLIPELRGTALEPIVLEEFSAEVGRFDAAQTDDRPIGISIKGRADLGTLSVGPVSFGSVELEGFFSQERKEITFATPRPIALELIPGKRVEFSRFFLSVSDKKAAENKKADSRIIIRSEGRLLTASVELELQIARELERVIFRIGRGRLGEMLPEFSESVARDIVLEGVEFEFEAASLKNKKGAVETFTLKATADLSTLPLGSSAIKGVLLEGGSGQDGVTLSAKISGVDLPEGVRLENVNLDIFGSPKKTKPSVVTVSGNAIVPVPGMQPIPVKLAGSFNSKKELELTGKPVVTVSINELQFKDPRVIINMPQGKLSVAGSIEIVPGYSAELSLALDKKSKSVVGQAEISGKPIKPLQDFPQLGEFSQIEIKNPRIEVGTNLGSQFIGIRGRAVVLGGQYDADVRIGSNKDGKTVRIELGAGGGTISSMIKPLSGTIFDDIHVEDARLIIASADEYDEARSVTIKQGLNFYGRAILKGALAPVETLTELDDSASVMIFAAIPTDPRQAIFKAIIPSGLVIKPDVASFKELALEIGGLPVPGISLICSVTIKPSPKDVPLTLLGRIKVGVSDALFATTLKGMWQNPFGLTGLQIGDIAAQIGIDYVLLVESGLPENIGIAGALQLGKAKVLVAGKVAVKNQDESMMIGSITELELRDIADALGKMVKKPIPTDNLPEIALNEVSLYVVPKSTSIGEIQYKEGMGGGAVHLYCQILLLAANSI